MMNHYRHHLKRALPTLLFILLNHFICFAQYDVLINGIAESSSGAMDGQISLVVQEKLEEIFLHLIDLDREITILEAEIFILEWTQRPQ